MKQSKHHIVNWSNGKTYCGLNFKSDSIRLAQFEDGDWIDDYGDELDTTKWNETFCINCLKLHDTQLVEQFKLQTFLIEYQLSIPKSKRLRNKKNAQLRTNRRKGIKKQSISEQLESKWNPPKSDKGKKRAKRKAQSKSKPVINSDKTKQVMELYKRPTIDKCRIVNKPKKEKEKKQSNKPLLNPGDIIELTEEVKIPDSFLIGDKIEDDVIEMEINSNWKMVRHDKQLDLWKLQVKSVNKKNKVSKWIDDTEYCPYDFISEIVNAGYCN